MGLKGRYRRAARRELYGFTRWRPRRHGPRQESASERNRRKRTEKRQRAGRIPGLENWLTVREVAEELGRSQTFVKTWAADVGARQIPNVELGVSQPGYSWRFHRQHVERLRRISEGSR